MRKQRRLSNRSTDDFVALWYFNNKIVAKYEIPLKYGVLHSATLIKTGAMYQDFGSAVLSVTSPFFIEIQLKTVNLVNTRRISHGTTIFDWVGQWRVLIWYCLLSDVCFIKSKFLIWFWFADPHWVSAHWSVTLKKIRRIKARCVEAARALHCLGTTRTMEVHMLKSYDCAGSCCMYENVPNIPIKYCLTSSSRSGV